MVRTKGAQEILEHLPHEEVLPEDLPVGRRSDLPRNLLYKVAFSAPTGSKAAWSRISRRP
jgi:hypothetical protein